MVETGTREVAPDAHSGPRHRLAGASVLGSAVNDQPAIAEDETNLPDCGDIGARVAANGQQVGGPSDRNGA
jgi:hypothetical protein